MTISFQQTVPVLRMFSLDKAREFYLDFLGFKLDWESDFGKNAPVYMQVSRDGIVLHLSEHHGDGVPGAVVHVQMRGLDDLHHELNAKNYRHMKPGILDQTWGLREMHVIDPFGNRIRFGEPKYEGA